MLPQTAQRTCAAGDKAFLGKLCWLQIDLNLFDKGKTVNNLISPSGLKSPSDY